MHENSSILYETIPINPYSDSLCVLLIIVLLTNTERWQSLGARLDSLHLHGFFIKKNFHLFQQKNMIKLS